MRKKTISLTDSERLDEIIRLLQFVTAVELYKAGVKQSQISKNLKIANATVNNILKGVKKITFAKSDN